ncbi:MAG: hypothetical protein JXA67_09790 [Micromonosporaceae bacterium]|nr:hypothetical protein [Micromonosporaceae bacterium]
MAVEYRLTLAGRSSTEEIATRAVADPGQRPKPTPYGRALAADLYEELGFGLDILSGQHGCFEGESDTGIWVWEPDAFVSTTFRITKNPERYDEALRNTLEIVARLLASGTEDAAFMLDADTLLLTRVNGQTQKHRRASWWHHYGYAGDLIPG